MAFLSLLATLAWGWLLVRWIDPACSLRPRWAARLLEVAMGAGVGAGISSTVYFLMLIAGAASQVSIFIFHGVALVGLAVANTRKKVITGEPVESSENRVTRFRWNWVLVLLLASLIVPIAITEARSAASNPHGLWDAWAIWNLRAKFLAGEGDAWRNALSPMLSRTHPDYPLLLSGFVAMNWRAAGGETDSAVPVATTFLFAGALIALLGSSLALLRRTSLGLLAVLVLFSDRPFLTHLGAQMADIPLAFYYLAALAAVFLSLKQDGRQRPILVLAGVLVALAAWTKDEGILFAAVILMCYAAIEFWSGGVEHLRRRVLWSAAGALPGLILIGCFKLLIVPHVNPMTAQRPAAAVARMAAGDRWANLFSAFFQVGADRGDGFAQPLLILGLVVLGLGFGLALRYKKPLAFGALTICGTFAGYCAAVLMNPTLLGSPYQTPFDRMFSQLWPSVLFLAFLSLRAMEELAPPVRVSETRQAAGKDKKRRRG